MVTVNSDCKQGAPNILFHFIFLLIIFVMTCLMMAWWRVETCSTHVSCY